MDGKSGMTNSCHDRPSSATPSALERLLPTLPCPGRTMGTGPCSPCIPKWPFAPLQNPDPLFPTAGGDPAFPQRQCSGAGTSRGTHRRAARSLCGAVCWGATLSCPLFGSRAPSTPAWLLVFNYVRAGKCKKPI